MCGRARCTLGADDIPMACHRAGPPVCTVDMGQYRPSYNVSPGSSIPVVRREDESGKENYAVHCMRWGLVPSFTKKYEKPDFYRMFNARSESVGEKPSFRRLLTRTRCLVPVEGFYEWKKDGLKKQPYYIHFKDGRPLVLAALYDHWQNSEGETLYTFTILTTSASSALLWLHDRMPVILGNKEATDAWLIGSSSSKFDAVLKPYEDSDLVWYAVSSAMGKPSLDGPECIKEIQLKTEDKGTISKFFRKEIKEALESKKEGRTCDKSPRTVVLKSVKDEYESEDKLEKPSFKMVHQDLKSSLSTTRNEDQTKCKIKRGHEELLSDPKWDSNKNDSLHSSPAKIAKPKNSDDKRSTLFSYYGRK